MTVERATAVGRAFDAHPLLRPLKVGGDPARIKVESSMEALIAKHGLPLEWLTVRRNGRYPDFEGGEISLLPGRGGYVGDNLGGTWNYSATGNHIDQSWLASTLSPDGALTEVASLFHDLVVALDAAYGNVAVGVPRVSTSARIPTKQIPGVFWLNYFGPAFRTKHAELWSVDGAHLLSTGGVLIQTSATPASKPTKAQKQTLKLLGKQALTFHMTNPALPSAEDQFAASPGTMEMPWVKPMQERDEAARVKRHDAAQRRLAGLIDARPEPVLSPEATEWSTSFDADDWAEFAKYLKRSLRGDLSSAIGTAALAVINSAPIEEEAAVLLNTKFGVVSLGWFIDDIDTVDVYLFGPPAVREICDSWLSE